MLYKEVMTTTDTDRAFQSSVAQRLLVSACIDGVMSDVDELSRLFYKALFHRDINLKRVLPGNVIFLNRKFTNLLGTFRNVKHLEKIVDSITQMGERHILNYGVEVEFFATAKPALLEAFTLYLEAKFDDELTAAWSAVYDDVVMVMGEAMSRVDRRKRVRLPYDEESYDTKLLEDIGGREAVLRIHQRFYDVIFDDPWLGQFFLGKPKTMLIRKQTDFMVAALGGENRYSGDTPAFVHMHMYVTDEMAEFREKILYRAILDEGLSSAIAERWLKVDRSFKTGIVKQSIEECVLKCPGQRALTAKKPIA